MNISPVAVLAVGNWHHLSAVCVPHLGYSALGSEVRLHLHLVVLPITNEIYFAVIQSSMHERYSCFARRSSVGKVGLDSYLHEGFCDRKSAQDSPVTISMHSHWSISPNGACKLPKLLGIVRKARASHRGIINNGAALLHYI